MSHAITAQESAQIIAALKAGKSVSEIAADFRRAESTVDKMRAKYRLPLELRG